MLINIVQCTLRYVTVHCIAFASDYLTLQYIKGSKVTYKLHNMV